MNQVPLLISIVISVVLLILCFIIIHTLQWRVKRTAGLVRTLKQRVNEVYDQSKILNEHWHELYGRFMALNIGPFTSDGSSLNAYIRQYITDPNSISNGTHTFHQLYATVYVMFIQLCFAVWRDPYGADIWRCIIPEDGNSTVTEFYLGIGTEKGQQMRMKLPIYLWDVADIARVYTEPPEFDGHTADDIITRMNLYLRK